MKSFSTFKNNALKNKEVRKAYDKLGPEFALVETIIAKRMQRGMTQAQLAKKMGTKQSAVARLESGYYNPSIDFLQRVAVALNTKLIIALS